MRCSSAIVVCLLAAAGPALADPPEPAPIGATAEIDHVVALVDGTPIWKSQVDEVLAPVLAHDPKAFRGELEPKAIEELVGSTLVQNRAKSLHVEATDDEIDRAVKEVMDENHIDQAGLAAALVQNGLTMPVYREDIRRQLVEGKTFRLWLGGQSIDATDAEVDAMAAQAKSAGSSTLSRDAIKELLVNEKLQAARTSWMNQLRRSARIERR